jgi:hypothetical protein
VGFKYDQPGTKSTKAKLYPGLYTVGSAYNGGKFSDPFTNVPLYLSLTTISFIHGEPGNFPSDRGLEPRSRRTFWHGFCSQRDVQQDQPAADDWVRFSTVPSPSAARMRLPSALSIAT